MTRELCIGVAANGDSLEMAAVQSGRSTGIARFPATAIGVEAIRMFLADCSEPLRLAVAGAGAVSIALALGNMSGRHTFIVSPSVADQPIALARYAGHVP